MPTNDKICQRCLKRKVIREFLFPKVRICIECRVAENDLYTLNVLRSRDARVFLPARDAKPASFELTQQRRRQRQRQLTFLRMEQRDRDLISVGRLPRPRKALGARVCRHCKRLLGPAQYGGPRARICMACDVRPE